MSKYVIGLDFGTDSVRALVVNAQTGEEIGKGTSNYVRWETGDYCQPIKSQFRQHPLDYIEAMTMSIQAALGPLSKQVRANITALSIDTTGSTPVAVDEHNTPLSMLPGFEENPNAMFILWKDHTAKAEAAEITSLAHQWEVDYTKYSGGTYSPEWFWSKILHIIRKDAAVAEKAYSWIEHCDWMVSLLTGVSDPATIKRSRCAAGHKAMWHETFGGLPSETFLGQLDPRLVIFRERLYTQTYTSDEPAGIITPYWARSLGLPEDVIIGVGGLDAHFGAVGACIEQNTLVKVIGTSTCDMLVAPYEAYSDRCIEGICGQVNGSILPGMVGLEAGQSAFGDLYNWFRQLLSFPLKDMDSELLSRELSTRLMEQILPALSKNAAALPVSDEDPVALDWINGRRTPNADLSLKAIIDGLHLGLEAPHLFKAFVEATAFGSRAIVENFIAQGITISRLVALGGISKKSSFVLQVLSDVLNMPISTVRSHEACALGAAIFAATVGGIYRSVPEAQHAMSSGLDQEYVPCKQRAVIYNQLYHRYQTLGNCGTGQKRTESSKAFFNLEEM